MRFGTTVVDVRDGAEWVLARGGRLQHVRPEAVVLGAPVYDESAPRSRLLGRQLTRFWCNVETFGRVIDDPMCGFRCYPHET